MNSIDLQNVENPPTVFTVEVRPDPRIHRLAAGVPVALTDDNGLALWTPILGPASVLLARLLLSEPGRTWHIGDIAGQLGLGVSYAHKVIRRLAQFGWLDATDTDRGVTLHVLAASTLKDAQVERLHPDLAARYARISGLVGERS
jgi:hypothetical protein